MLSVYAKFALMSLRNHKKKGVTAPKHNVSIKTKLSESWHKNVAEYIFHKHLKGLTLYGQPNIHMMKENRSFGSGTESPNRYKKLLGKDKGNNERELEQKVYENINWERMSVLPKFRHIVINKYMAVDHKIDVHAIDKEANNKRGLEKWKNRLEDELAKVLGDDFKRAQGVAPEIERIRPKDADHAKIIERLGGQKLEGEIVHEKLLIANFAESDWPEVKRAMLGDLFDNNVAACRDYTCSVTGKSKARYVDPISSGTSHNKNGGTNNGEFSYEFITKTITELKQEPQLSHLKESDWEDMAKATGNIDRDKVDRVSDITGKVTTFEYDEVNVLCLDYEYCTTDKEFWTFREKNGVTKKIKEKYGKVYDTPVRKTEVEAYRNFYKGTYILDEGYVFNYGQQYDIPRPTESEARSSFRFYKIPGPSIVELAKGDVEDIRLAQIKLQNAVSKAKVKGMVLDWSALKGVNIGGASDAKPLDLIRLQTSEGTLLINTGNTTGIIGGGNRNLGGSGLPFKETEGGVGQFLNESVTIITNGLNNIRSLTGINEIVDGSSPNPETTARQAMLSQASSNNALGSILAAYQWLKIETAKNLALRTQLYIKASGKSYQSYVPIIGSSGSKYIEMTADQTFEQLGMLLRMMPSDEEITDLLLTAKEAVAAGAIDVVEYHIIAELARDGRTEEAMVIVDYRLQQKKKNDAAVADANIKSQAETLLAQEEKKKETLQFQSDLKVDEARELAKIEVWKERRLKGLERTHGAETKQDELMLDKMHGQPKEGAQNFGL